MAYLQYGSLGKTYTMPTSDMREIQIVMPAQTSPGLTRSAADIGEPGKFDKWKTGTITTHLWTRDEMRTRKVKAECKRS